MSETKQIRLFISSTFKDMHAERDHLITVVFPELRERLSLLGLELYDVDLRWGVPDTDADGERSNSWEYCKKWIDKVEPFFICVLGERYGWVPEIDALTNDEEKAIQSHTPRSITELEVHHAVFQGRRDLKCFFYFRGTKVPRPTSDDEEEWRRYREFVDSPEQLTRLEALKSRITSHGLPVRRYQCSWSGGGFTDLDAFGDQVLEDIWNGILRDRRYIGEEAWAVVSRSHPELHQTLRNPAQPMPQEIWRELVSLSRLPAQSPADRINEQMKSFAATTLRWFEGRESELDALLRFIDSDSESEPRIMLVRSPSGMGKSALLAALSERIDRNRCTVISHFTGVGENSSTSAVVAMQILLGLPLPDNDAERYRREYSQLQYGDPFQLFQELASAVAQYKERRRVVILLDAINQLSNGHDLNWLPMLLASNVRIIMSCLDESEMGSEPMQVLEKAIQIRTPSLRIMQLGGLSEGEKRSVIIHYLAEYCKLLDSEHVKTLCSIPQTSSPLYLLVLLNELRLLSGNDLNVTVPKLVASLSCTYPDIRSLFNWVLQRLETFGQEAAGLWCSYLYSGRAGMSGSELQALMRRKLGNEAAKAGLRVERGLRKYLQTRGTELDFFHTQLRQVVYDRYCSRRDLRELHHDIAEYFSVNVTRNEIESVFSPHDIRGLSECIFHRISAGELEKARSFLMDFSFLINKTRFYLLESLLDDYIQFFEAIQHPESDPVFIWYKFILANIHFLRRGKPEWPAEKILLQVAAESPHVSPITQAVENWLKTTEGKWLWIKACHRSIPSDSLLTVETESDHLMELPDGKVLTVEADNSVWKIWDVSTLRCLHYSMEHGKTQYGMQRLPDGRIATWGWIDHSYARYINPQNTREAPLLDDVRAVQYAAIRIWDRHAEYCLLELKEHTKPVWGIQYLRNNRLASYTDDAVIRVWNLTTGACDLRLEGHTNKLAGIKELEDGRLLSWSRGDNTLRIWNSETGAVEFVHNIGYLGELEALSAGSFAIWARDWDKILILKSHKGEKSYVINGHSSRMLGVKAVSDQFLVFWGDDGRFHWWNYATKQAGISIDSTTGIAATEATPKPPRGYGKCLMVEPDFILVWQSVSRTGVHVLDRETGRLIRSFDITNDEIESIHPLTRGRILVVRKGGLADLWLVTGSSPIGTLRGHTGTIGGVLELSNGMLATTGSDNTLRLWDLEAVSKSPTVPPESIEIETPFDVVTFPNGHLLLTGRQTMRIIDNEGREIVTFGPITGKILDVSSLSSDRILIRIETEVQLWDVNTGKMTNKFEEKNIRIAKCISNERVLLIIGGWTEAQQMLIFNTESVTPVLRIEIPEGRVEEVIDIDTDRFLSAESHGMYSLWDSFTGSCLVRISTENDHVSGGCIPLSSRDRVVSFYRLGNYKPGSVIQIWDTRTGSCINTITVEKDSIKRMVEFPNGWVFAFSYTDNIVVIDPVHGALIGRLPAAEYPYNLAWLPSNRAVVFSMKATTLSGLNEETWRESIKDSEYSHSAIPSLVKLEKGKLQPIQEEDFLQVQEIDTDVFLFWTSKGLEIWNVSKLEHLLSFRYANGCLRLPDCRWGHAEDFATAQSGGVGLIENPWKNELARRTLEFMTRREIDVEVVADARTSNRALSMKVFGDTIAEWHTDKAFSIVFDSHKGDALIQYEDGSLIPLHLYFGNERISYTELREKYLTPTLRGLYRNL